MDSLAAFCSTENLCLAAVAGDYKLLEKQIKAGVSVDKKHESTGLFPLHFVVKGRSAKCLEIFLSQNAINVNCSSVENGETPLHLAVKSALETDPRLIESDERFKICKELVEHSADILALSANGGTPLHLALTRFSSTSIKLAKMLLKSDLVHKDEDISDISIHTQATSALLKMLKEADPSLEYSSDSKLDLIRAASKWEALKGLLEMHERELITSGLGKELTTVAKKIVQTKLFTIVLEEFKIFDEGTLVLCIGETLSKACKNQDNSRFESITSFLTKESVALFNKFTSSFENQPLIACIKHSRCSSCGDGDVADKIQYERIEKLLQIGFNPTVPRIRKSYLDPNDGVYYCASWVPLYSNIYQSERLSLNIISYFIHALNDCKHSPMAAKFVQLLLKYGAYPNPITNSEISPLMVITCKEKDSKTIQQIYKLLLSSGADLNYKSSTSPFKCSNVVLTAALMNAYFSGKDIEVLVVEHGLDPMDLLTDLANFQFSTTASESNRELIIENIAYFLDWLLYDFAIKWTPVLTKVRQIQENLLRDAPPPDPSPDVFDDIYATFTGEIPTLQSVCRASLRETIAHGKLCDMKGRINRLPLPENMNKYLNFPIELRAS